MIYTQYGVEVEIVAASADQTTVMVQEIGTDWRRVRRISDLKADGGLPEVLAAIDTCEHEYPSQPSKVMDVFEVTEAPRNPITGRFIRCGEGR